MSEQKILTYFSKNSFEVESETDELTILNKNVDLLPATTFLIGSVLIFSGAVQNTISLGGLLIVALGLITITIAGSMVYTRPPKQVSLSKKKGAIELSYGLAGHKRILLNRIKNIVAQNNGKGNFDVGLKLISGKSIPLFKLDSNTSTDNEVNELTSSLKELLVKN